jgi:hypothetical protein
VTRFALIALLALTVAGCGGGGGSGTLYTLAKTRQCLKANPAVAIDRKLDFIATTASGGALHLVMPQNAATLVFGETVADADNINDAYHRFSSKNVGVDDVLRQQNNAVMLFHVHPSDANIATIENCLR